MARVMLVVVALLLAGCASAGPEPLPTTIEPEIATTPAEPAATTSSLDADHESPRLLLTFPESPTVFEPEVVVQGFTSADATVRVGSERSEIRLIGRPWEMFTGR